MYYLLVYFGIISKYLVLNHRDFYDSRLRKIFVEFFKTKD